MEPLKKDRNLLYKLHRAKNYLINLLKQFNKNYKNEKICISTWINRSFFN